MTLAALMPYLLVAGGYLIRHFDILGKAASLLAGSNPLASPAAPAKSPVFPSLTLGNHPVLSDAVNAAIKQAVGDAVGGHVTSIRGEIEAAVKAAVSAAVADLKPKG